jgi:ABC-type phosphonate transport system ATPase subunit
VTERLLRVHDLSKFYGSRMGCADVSFDLWPGEVLGHRRGIRLGQDDAAATASRPGMDKPDEGQVSPSTAMRRRGAGAHLLGPQPRPERRFG